MDIELSMSTLYPTKTKRKRYLNLIQQDGPVEIFFVKSTLVGVLKIFFHFEKQTYVELEFQLRKQNYEENEGKNKL